MNKLITISSALLTAAAVKRKRPILYLYWRMIWVMETSRPLIPNLKSILLTLTNWPKHGIAFTDAHASSALSTPSRYSLLTGRYPWRTKLKRGGLDGDSLQ